MALLYGDYKNIRCSRQASMIGYGRIPYSELAIYGRVQGYTGSDLRDFIDELQWVDAIYNEVEQEHLQEKSKAKGSNGQGTAVRPPNAKEQTQQREIRRSRVRPPINGLR